MGVLDGTKIDQGEGQFRLNVGRFIVINRTLLHTCVKVREAIKLLFRVVSGVGRGMGVLDGIHIWKNKGEFGGFLPIGLNGILYLTCA